MNQDEERYRLAPFTFSDHIKQAADAKRLEEEMVVLGQPRWALFWELIYEQKVKDAGQSAGRKG